MSNAAPARSSSGGGFFILIFVGLLLFGGGCEAKHAFTSHDTSVTNPDGSNTYTSNYTDGSLSGGTTCTTTADYSSTNCTSTP